MQQPVIEVPKPPLFSFNECLWFLDRGYDDCLFQIRDASVTKAIFIENKPVLFRVSEQEEQLHVNIIQGDPSPRGRLILKDYVMDWFDMHTDLDPFYGLLQKHRKLAYMSTDYKGLRLINITDLFEALCWSIIGQQINLTFAYKLKRRLVETYGTALEAGGEKHYLFPAPAMLAQLSTSDLRPLQFSESKARYVIGIAGAFASGQLSKEMLTSLPGFEKKQQALTAFKGIGIWTANYVLMKTMRESSAIPFGDVGLLKALENHNIIKERDEEEKIHALFRRYKGWESYLVFYLWRSLASPVFQR